MFERIVKRSALERLKAQSPPLARGDCAEGCLPSVGRQSESESPAQDSRSRFLPGAGIVAVVVLLLVSFLLPYLNTGYTTNDDMHNAVISHSCFVQLSKFAGRFFFVSLHGLTASAAHVCRDTVLAKAMSFSAIVLNFILFGWLVHRVAGNTAMTWLTLLAWITLQRDGWEHYLITSSPLIYTVPLSLFFLSLITCDRGIEKKSNGMLFLSAVLYALALQYSEMFYALVFCFLPILYRHPAASWKSLFFHGVFIVLMSLLYAVWRATYPSLYEGNTLGTSFQFKDFLRTLWTYSFSGFPACQCQFFDEVRRFSGFGGVSLNPLHGLPDPSVWLQNLRHFEPAWLLRAALAGGVAWILLRRFAAAFSFSTWAVISAFAACLILLPNLPHALTPKYQFWVCRDHSQIYVGTYYSFFGICLLMGAIACHLTALARPGLIRIAVAGLFAMLAFWGTLDVSAWNEAETTSKVYSHRKWELFDDFLSSASFRNVPSGSIIYAPTLRTRGFGCAAPVLGYWREYVRYKTGKNIHVVTGQEGMARVLSDNAFLSVPWYYLKYSADDNRAAACLLFAPIHDLQTAEDSEDPIRVIADEAEVLFRPSLTRRILLFQDKTGDHAVEVPDSSSAGNSMFHLKGKGIRLNSVFAVNNPDALRFESPRRPPSKHSPP